MIAVGPVLVQDACWACGRVLTRQTSLREAAERQFGWGFVCGVSWIGPGELAGPASTNGPI